jgi:hypothetical protein
VGGRRVGAIAMSLALATIVSILALGVVGHWLIAAWTIAREIHGPARSRTPSSQSMSQSPRSTRIRLRIGRSARSDEEKENVPLTLIKLAERYLNLDHLVAASILFEKDGEPAVALRFAAPVDSEWGAPNRIVLRGDEAATVLGWLEARILAEGKPSIAPWPALIPDDFDPDERST